MGCTSDVEEFAKIYSNVVSLEACIKRAEEENEPFLNFRVSTGSCRLLHCGVNPTSSDYELTNSDYDIYIY
eukprot:Awhi_evm1s13454